MKQPGPPTTPRPPDTQDDHPGPKTYTPRLEEFEQDVAFAIARYHELPDWLKARMKGRLRSR